MYPGFALPQGYAYSAQQQPPPSNGAASGRPNGPASSAHPPQPPPLSSSSSSSGSPAIPAAVTSSPSSRPVNGTGYAGVAPTLPPPMSSAYPSNAPPNFTSIPARNDRMTTGPPPPQQYSQPQYQQQQQQQQQQHPYPAGVPSQTNTSNQAYLEGQRPPLPYAPSQPSSSQSRPSMSYPPSSSAAPSSHLTPAMMQQKARREEALTILRSPLAEIARRLHIKDKSAEELESLLDNESAFLEYLTSLPMVNDVKAFIKEQEKENEELAKSTLDIEKDLQALYLTLATLKSDQESLQLDYEKEKAEQESHTSKTSLSATTASVRQWVAQLEQKSESLAMKWQDGELTNLDPKDFIKQYRELRQQFHYHQFLLQWLLGQQSIR